MGKYKLKNRVLQGHLDVISGGEFSEVLKSGNVEFDEDGFAVIPVGPSKHDNNKVLITGKFTVTLYKDEVYELTDYDPNEWNWWPKVEPPKNVDMRVELYGKDEALDTPEPRLGREYFKGFGFWDGDRWCVYGIRVLDGSKVRFRPWE